MITENRFIRIRNILFPNVQTANGIRFGENVELILESNGILFFVFQFYFIRRFLVEDRISPHKNLYGKEEKIMKLREN